MTITPDFDRALFSTADAFCDTLHAVLDEDLHRAREVLKGSAVRRRLVRAAVDSVRDQAWVPARQLNERLQFVDDVSRANALIDQLARRVVSRDDPVSLTPARRMEVAVLLDAGGRRLRQLADGPVGPALDPAYRGCGAALFEVADHGERDASLTIALCGALAVVLLQASRHATRAA
ncbi:hypothetical protein BJ980_000198 [Nocardioides daedukensis]|uniref:Uncharacterized protein n=1 Tax=Nocardioides daedukensis TaxID=634462 RepID=A0A7Y9S0K7_9ACTN|nr:hypothetical protein [Nocardioides daedukensis]NYG57275.1 hypothetical protein [Nocardioides daedukensis]